jgi:transposase, IS5 family
MTLWKILVLGTLRLNCNFDFDKVQEMANQHRTLRQMLGHGFLDDNKEYAIQTIKDNVQLLTPEILDQINEIVVKEGHKLVMGKKKENLRCSCDSFVVETDVHYPTDINLLFDAIRKVISLIGYFCEEMGITDWRQSKHNLKRIKRLFRKCQNLRHSRSKNPDKKAERQQFIIEAHEAYIDLVQSSLIRVKITMKKYAAEFPVLTGVAIDEYIKHADRQIDQIKRRIIQGETIPHHEKIFSIFEEHTEWIVKGKAGISQELGHLVCIIKDQFGFILNHRVMEKEKDINIAVSFTGETKEKFPEMTGCSFDGGFYSPENKEKLKEMLNSVTLPKKGRLTLKEQEEEYSEEFIKSKRKHSAVEASISTLENHGLDRCLDMGLHGFKRYVSLAVLARNIQILGNHIQQKKLKKLERREKQKLKLAA